MNLRKITFAMAAVAGFGIIGLGAAEAKAGGWSFGIHTGRAAIHVGHGYHGAYHGGYGRGRGHYDWHDTTHYDYHPGGYIRHGNHYDYVPGHYHLHRSGHWDYHRGGHGRFGH